MGLYSLALFAVTVLLVCVGSASTVAVAAVPVQETEKPSKTTSAKKHLRATKATDGDNEDRAAWIVNTAYFAENLGKLGSRFSKKAKALNARLFPKKSKEMLTSPLISKKHSSSWGLSDDPRWNKEEVIRKHDSVEKHDPQPTLTTPLISKKHSSSWGLSDDPRWNEKGDSVGKRDPQPMSVSDDPHWTEMEVLRKHDSVGKRDPQPMSVSGDPRWNEKGVTQKHDSVGKRDPQPKNDYGLKYTVEGMLDDLHDENIPMKYVYDLLKMQDDGYKGFDPGKLTILNNYRSKFDAKANMQSVEFFLREAVGTDEKFVLTLESMMKSERYEWLETEMLRVFGKWKHKKVADVEELLNEADPHNPRLVKATIEKLDKFRKGEIKK